MHRPGYGGGAHHTPSRSTQAQHLLYTPTWKLCQPLKGGFQFVFLNGGFIAQARLIKSLATSDWLDLSPEAEVGAESSNFNPKASSPGNQPLPPIPRGSALKKQVGLKGSLGITKYTPFTFNYFRAISGTWDQKKHNNKQTKKNPTIRREDQISIYITISHRCSLKIETKDQGTLVFTGSSLTFTSEAMLSTVWRLPPAQPWSPTLLASGADFVEDNFSTDWSGGAFLEDSSAWNLLCTLFLLLWHQLHLKSSAIRP